jgi:hypothetical protein
MTWTQNAINNLLATTALTGTLQAAQFPALTGDITTTAGALATTLATVNSNVGSFTNASITVNAKGLITAAANGTGSFTPLPITVVTTTTQTMTANHGYVANNAGLVTLTLPTTAALGSVSQVIGEGAGGWTIAQNSGQSIIFNSNTTTVGAGGSLSSTVQTDSVSLVCIVANTTFQVTASQGTLTGV